MFRRPSHLWAGGELGSVVVRRQVEWADHHRRVFQSTFAGFRDAKPYLVTEDRREHGGTAYRVLTARSEPAPDKLGLILGDYLNALRASLDYLVGEMRTSGPSQSSAFPIFTTRPAGRNGRFRQRACRHLHGVPDDAVRLVHWMQPYHPTDEGLRHAFKSLGALETLWNISKHRTLHVVTTATLPDYVWRERSGDGAREIAFRIPPDRSSEIWLPIADPPEAFGPEFTVRIALAQPSGSAADWPRWVEDWDLDALVDDFFRVVRWEIVPQFNPYLSQRG